MIFLLHYGLKKSRFHYFWGPKLQISWFLNVSTRRWAPIPTLFIFGETRTPQQILESIWEHPEKILSMEIWHLKISKNRNCVCTIFLCFYFLYIFWSISFVNYILRRWGIENYTFSITKQHPNLNVNFISSKKHEQDFTLNFVFSRKVP